QSRVQLAHIGHPVIGDAAYGRSAAKLTKLCHADRQMLHAYRLELDHPVTGERLNVTAPLPEDYLRVREELTALCLKKRSKK
ncbi:RNA pseudouridine synthase, partial [bacterium]|nr:RNA pseudouridine synthase [bacterium]